MIKNTLKPSIVSSRPFAPAIGYFILLTCLSFSPFIPCQAAAIKAPQTTGEGILPAETGFLSQATEENSPQNAAVPIPKAEEDSPIKVTPLQPIPLHGTISETLNLKGQDPTQVLEMNLPTLVKLVATKNLDVALAKENVDEAKGYVTQSVSQLFPSLRSQDYVENFRGGDIFIGPNPFPTSRVTYQPKFSVDYNIQLGGKTIYDIYSSKYQLQRIQSTETQVFQSALLDALTGYFTWLRDASGVTVAKQSLKEADAQTQYNESRFNAGFATRLDVTQSKTLQAQRRAELLKAENQMENSGINLAYLLNLPLTLKLELENSELKPITFMDDSLTLPQLYAMALETRPELKQMNLQIAEAKSRYGSARADIFPTMTLSAYKRGIGPRMDKLSETNETFGSISFDVLRNMGWSTMGNMQVSRAKIQEAYINKEKQMREIEKNLAQQYQDVRLYHAVIDVAKQKADAAFESYRIAGARLTSGVGINLELVQAQKDLTDARLEYETAVMNYNNAQLKIMYEAGQLNPQNLFWGLKQALEAEKQQAEAKEATQ